MMRYAMLPASVLAVVLVSGCSKGGESNESEADVCTNSVTVFPAANATNVYYRGSIEATFQVIDQSAAITVDGVSGSSEWRGNTLVFMPDSPLAPSTVYNASVSYECGDNPWSFTTGEVGSAVSGSLDGNTYALDLASGRFVQPAGVGTLLQEYLTTDVLIAVVGAPTTDIQMIGAIGIEGASTPTQDVCTETIPFPTADFAGNPFFQVGPETTTISVQGFDITIDDLMISGAFAPDGSYITGAVLGGNIDTRPLVPLLDENGADDALCQLAGSIGVSCEACSDGSGDFCLSLYVDSIQASLIAGGTIVQVDEVDCTGSCSTSSACEADTDVQ